ncbi:hypothetical protein SAMN05444422_110124 [Halobiforma haloterrestris]|uniref:Halobacterial output domain-containing protein n=1 Tax=Natronobacterium haloterrestre TaxID=148448 RepID=A0A1I1KBV7_NATHA|nr:HalOD1 output domain-containing protein [Halobiforma haloterrestris]SFC56178.1 hypothetical protein SAMN05444422_110124 [Halobiforma haloterrestris]
MSRGTPPSQRVVTKIAEADDVEPATLEPPLYSTIDPDALDALVESGDADTTVSFAYHGYEVRVDGTGEVTLTETDTGTGTGSPDERASGPNDDSRQSAYNDD